MKTGVKSVFLQIGSLFQSFALETQKDACQPSIRGRKAPRRDSEKQGPTRSDELGAHGARRGHLPKRVASLESPLFILIGELPP